MRAIRPASAVRTAGGERRRVVSGVSCQPATARYGAAFHYGLRPADVEQPPVGLAGADRPNVSHGRGAVLYRNDNCSAFLLPMIWAGVWPMRCFTDRVRCGWSK